MATLFNVTFEKINDESAAEGDCLECGFVIEGVRLRDAIYHVCGSSDPRSLPSCEANDSDLKSARWFDFYKTNEGTRESIEQGIDENRSIHLPESVTPSSRMRLARLFSAYGAK